MNSKIYDGMKQVSQVWLPLVAAMYFGLGQLWGFPKIEEVIGSITVVDTALGTAVVALSARYKSSGNAYGGELNIVDGEESTVMQLDVSKDPEALMNKKEILFKVNRESEAS